MLNLDKKHLKKKTVSVKVPSILEDIRRQVLATAICREQLAFASLDAVNGSNVYSYWA